MRGAFLLSRPKVSAYSSQRASLVVKNTMGLLMAFISLSCLASATESNVQLPATRIHERTPAHTCLRLKLAPPLPNCIPESAQKCACMQQLCLRGGGRGTDKVLKEAMNGTHQRSLPVTLTTDWRRTPEGGAYSVIEKETKNMMSC